MDDLSPFIKYIQRLVTLSPADLAEFLAGFKLKKVKKKQFIIQPDFIAKHRTYILQGAFRSYVVDNEGIEHTIQFAIEDWWISDINSFLYQKPATMFVVALEDSIVLQIDFETERHLKQAKHQFETFFRMAAERTAAFHQRRIISTLTRTAEERYSDFLETYPSVAQRLPQYAIASYLGMTTEFLSKIRNHKVRKKLK
ncbi:Crp/Fnr family transcriptional regulator [Mucilaginibacter ginsenosidivorax]|uniref:Crp/Fnr family transcriptional regulator n=1 Tax=Mucilaginibacter ginsenosidivorax TaxID=862126 RepID=A0A5B8W3P6_9SPHI|nr:Crp/Fnr family transcriptional regulator [Mucilaginibacter ginsenosidivorax]QEC77506.1 Crp/Fnr family transcriptional regulator [Mucilaginibacter ginsenosidivorax]